MSDTTTIDVRVPRMSKGKYSWTDGRILIKGSAEPVYLIRKGTFAFFQKATKAQANAIRNAAHEKGYMV